MIWPARLAVSAETGTRTSARKVSRQLSQIAMLRQLAIRRALIPEAREVERHRAPVKVVADPKQRELHHVGDEHFLKEEKESLRRHAEHHHEQKK
jgi:hypothetical protein